MPDLDGRMTGNRHEDTSRKIPWQGLLFAGGILAVSLIVLVLSAPAQGWVLGKLGAQPTPTATPDSSALPEPSSTPDPTSTPTPEPTAVPTLGMGSKRTSGMDGMVEVYVPEGDFQMGSGANTRTIYLDAFWIDRTDVTNSMYARCAAAGTCLSQDMKSSATRLNYYGNSQFDDYPVIHVNWSRADVYCKWAGRKLPTEAQWEKAARGTDGRRYPSGNGLDGSKANYHRLVGDTTKVGSYPDGASPYGALDMAGNVWQWVADWYDVYYIYTKASPDSNPAGPASGSLKGLRGGSWGSVEFNARSDGRYGSDPYNRDSDVGFRCAASVAP